jgi:hypothetical protein
MSETLPKSKPELLSEIEREWKELWRVIGRLTPEQMARADEAGWSPKDNLAHLAEWMNALMGYHMDRRPAPEVLGFPPEAIPEWDWEIINPLLHERNRARSADDVLADLKRTYMTLMARLRAMPFEDLMKPRHADDPERRPLLEWVMGDTTSHFAEHRLTIEKAL